MERYQLLVLRFNTLNEITAKQLALAKDLKFKSRHNTEVVGGTTKSSEQILILIVILRGANGNA